MNFICEKFSNCTQSENCYDDLRGLEQTCTQGIRTILPCRFTSQVKKFGYFFWSFLFVKFYSLVLIWTIWMSSIQFCMKSNIHFFTPSVFIISIFYWKKLNWGCYELHCARNYKYLKTPSLSLIPILSLLILISSIFLGLSWNLTRCFHVRSLSTWY